MSYSLDDPGFSASAEVSQEAPPPDPSPPPQCTGSTSSSASSSGDSKACRNCLKCRRRMSKPVFDRRTVCFICRGVDCSLDSHCDECLDWSPEEMEAYLRHRLSLLLKDHCRKDSLPKPPSSPVPSPSPSSATSGNVSNVDDRFDAKLAALSVSFEHKLDALSSLILSKIASLHAPLEQNMSARMPTNVFCSSPGSTGPLPLTRVGSASPEPRSYRRLPPRVTGGWG